MASVQVLPNSAAASTRKQEHLEAGKRRLEEFRKKKEAERAKKVASSSQVQNSAASLKEKQPSEIEHVRINELYGVSTSDGIGIAAIDTATAGMSNDTGQNMFVQGSNWSSLPGTTSSASNDLNALSVSLAETHANIDEVKKSKASGLIGSAAVSQNNEANQVNDVYGIHGDLGGVLYGTRSHQSTLLHSQESEEFGSNASQSSLHGLNEAQSNKSDNSLKDYTLNNSGSSPYFTSKFSPQNSVDTPLQIKPTNSSTLDNGHSQNLLYGGLNDSLSSDMRMTITSSVSDLPSLHSGANHIPVYSVSTESSSRRSRPFFLDSLNVARPSSGAPSQQPQKYSSTLNHFESSGIDISGSIYPPTPSVENKTLAPFSNFPTPNAHSAFDHSTNSSFSNSNSQEMLVGKAHDFFSPTQNKDFAELEQHIEDLTQEKFSLQHALDTSRALAESLAAENSSLTDSYNQQRSVVNQLKFDMERLQEEIKAQLVELESLRSEYTNAQLECNAADERAKLLASEVIGLEEKALRLRSSELKLEKQVENAQAEISSYRKRMSSLEKERHDLQSTIDVLKEEKLLQFKLRKASGTGKSIQNLTNKSDASTSTDDMENTDSAASTPNQEMHDSAAVHDAQASSPSLVTEIGHSSFPADIPRDQMRMIENINALISELALEKEELVKTLTIESSECSRMKELNKDLSRKLEVQTQRLELLTAQSMANEHLTAKQPDSRTIYENTQYADEGDEVVERVLGWIMQLFPGGPSRRRSSKLL